MNSENLDDSVCQCLKSRGRAGRILRPSRPGRILNSNRLFRGFNLVLGD